MHLYDCALHPINNLGHMKVSHSLKANKVYEKPEIKFATSGLQDV